MHFSHCYVCYLCYIKIQRWTTRTQQLNEQNNKANRELDDLKNMQKSKAQNDSVITALKDENARLKGQKEAMTKEIHKLKRDAAETQVGINAYIPLYLF